MRETYVRGATTRDLEMSEMCCRVARLSVREKVRDGWKGGAARIRLFRSAKCAEESPGFRDRIGNERPRLEANRRVWLQSRRVVQIPLCAFDLRFVLFWFCRAPSNRSRENTQPRPTVAPPTRAFYTTRLAPCVCSLVSSQSVVPQKYLLLGLSLEMSRLRRLPPKKIGIKAKARKTGVVVLGGKQYRSWGLSSERLPVWHRDCFVELCGTVFTASFQICRRTGRVQRASQRVSAHAGSRDPCDVAGETDDAGADEVEGEAQRSVSCLASRVPLDHGELGDGVADGPDVVALLVR